MKVISIGTDRKLFEKGSAVLARNIEYASKIDELHIVVFSLKKLRLEPFSIGNLHIYPTNSTYRFFYIFDAFRIGKQIIENCKLETKPRSELRSTTGIFLIKLLKFGPLWIIVIIH